MSDQHVTAFVMLASATNHLPALCFIRVQKRLRAVGLTLQTRLVTGYSTVAGRL